MKLQKIQSNPKSFFFRIIIFLLVLGMFLGLVIYYFNSVPQSATNFSFFLAKNFNQIIPVENIKKTQENLNQIGKQSDLTIKCLFIDTQILLQDDKGNCVIEAYDLTNVDFGKNFKYLQNLPKTKQKLFFYNTNKNINYIRYLNLDSIFGDRKVTNLQLESDNSWSFSVEGKNYSSEPEFQKIKEIK